MELIQHSAFSRELDFDWDASYSCKLLASILFMGENDESGIDFPFISRKLLFRHFNHAKEWNE